MSFFSGTSHRPHYLVLQFLWCTTHALRLLLLVEPCHKTKNEVVYLNSGTYRDKVLCLYVLAIFVSICT